MKVIGIILIIGILGGILLDLLGKWDMMKKRYLVLWLTIFPQGTLVLYFLYKNRIIWELSWFELGVITFVLSLFAVYFWIRINFFPCKKSENESNRLNMLLGGRFLLLSSLATGILQSGLGLVYLFGPWRVTIPLWVALVDGVLSIGFIGLLFLNGFIRVMAVSRRLTLFSRLFMILTLWIPGIHFFMILYLSHQAMAEFDHESNKVVQNNLRIDSAICQTKYPLVMLHGVGFRDLRYFNYWGRIPKELVRNGATIYYGHQEAWGTIESNAEDVKKVIMEILEERKCGKVNIIGHSKGGLDARYMISQLGMSEYVASLTTISSPHHGSHVIDFIYKFPKGFIAFIAKQFDRYFRVLGDKNPDFATASQQFLTKNSQHFNEKVVDKEGVYYQSYASVMNSFLSDYILWLPYLIIYFLSGPNDGLVAVDSARWGEFKGVMKSTSLRGISHGDVIDLRRHEYKGFDIREHYVRLVADLKERGY